jgi:hypothetical protein
VSTFVVMHRQNNLLQVIDALRSTSRLTSLLNCREQQRYQDRYDGNHHQKLDECEPANSVSDIGPYRPTIGITRPVLIFHGGALSPKIPASTAKCSLNEVYQSDVVLP